MFTPHHSFYGITILQTVVYYKQNPNDPWLFQYGVCDEVSYRSLTVAYMSWIVYRLPFYGALHESRGMH